MLIKLSLELRRKKMKATLKIVKMNKKVLKMIKNSLRMMRSLMKKFQLKKMLSHSQTRRAQRQNSKRNSNNL
jgi:hypothetical protein